MYRLATLLLMLPGFPQRRKMNRRQVLRDFIYEVFRMEFPGHRATFAVHESVASFDNTEAWMGAMSYNCLVFLF